MQLFTNIKLLDQMFLFYGTVYMQICQNTMLGKEIKNIKCQKAHIFQTFLYV